MKIWSYGPVPTNQKYGENKGHNMSIVQVIIVLCSIASVLPPCFYEKI